ncbi:MAG: hypothetical protein U0W24_05870 [Bacteroidales bacterium]
MKTKKAEKLRMFNALIQVMENHKKIWSRVAEIENAFKLFHQETSHLNMLKADYDKSLIDLERKKSEARKKVVNETIPVANLMLAYAIENKDKKLENKISLTKSDLKELKDKKLVKKSKAIWKIAYDLNSNTNTSKLRASEKLEKNTKINSFGLNEQMLNNLELASIALIEAHLGLKDALIHKKKCGLKLKEGIKANRYLLKNKLDLLISIFKSSDPIFYKKYFETQRLNFNENVKQVEAKPKKDIATKKELVKNIKVVKEKTPIKVKAEPVKRTSAVRKPAIKTNPANKKVNSKVEKPAVSKTTSKKPVVRKNATEKPKVLKADETKSTEVKTDTSNSTPNK